MGCGPTGVLDEGECGVWIWPGRMVQPQHCFDGCAPAAEPPRGGGREGFIDVCRADDRRVLFDSADQTAPERLDQPLRDLVLSLLVHVEHAEEYEHGVVAAGFLRTHCHVLEQPHPERLDAFGALARLFHAQLRGAREPPPQRRRVVLVQHQHGNQGVDEATGRVARRGVKHVQEGFGGVQAARSQPVGHHRRWHPAALRLGLSQAALLADQLQTHGGLGHVGRPQGDLVQEPVQRIPQDVDGARLRGPTVRLAREQRVRQDGIDVLVGGAVRRLGAGGLGGGNEAGASLGGAPTSPCGDGVLAVEVGAEALGKEVEQQLRLVRGEGHRRMQLRRERGEGAPTRGRLHRGGVLFRRRFHHRVTELSRVSSCLSALLKNCPHPPSPNLTLPPRACASPPTSPHRPARPLACESPAPSALFAFLCLAADFTSSLHHLSHNPEHSHPSCTATPHTTTPPHMSEVQSRPARGRSTARGGRGGPGARRSTKQTNGDHGAPSIDTSADQGELGELKKQYLSQLTTLKELFPDWADVDLVLALQESDGDMERTIEKITEGNVSQFAEVKKTKDRSRSKVKETGPPAEGAPSSARGAARRGGGDSVRGRGRGTDRGRGGIRGGTRGGATNGTRTTGAPSVPTTESSAWDVAAPAEAKQSSAPPAAAAAAAAEAETPKPAASAAPAAPAKKTWASMFAPAPKPATPKPAAKPAPPVEDPVPAPTETPPQEVAQEPAVEAEELPIPPVADEVVEEPPVAAEDTPKLTPDKSDGAPVPEVTLIPSKDELTQDNVEHLPDESQPPPTDTAASTVASSRDIGSSVATPLSNAGQAPISRPAIGGFATTALKATAGANRSASFQRRLVEQQEAVVMPGKHAVNQAAVQFGSLGLNGEVDDSPDVDEDREEAETRTQPPQHSPVAQPRASLPPAPRQAAPVEAPPQELPTPKQAPGLPPPPQQQNLPQQSPPTSITAQAMQSQGSQQPYNQFGRYSQGGIQPEAAASLPKSYDPFGQQVPQSQYEYPNQQHAQQQAQVGAFSSAPDAFASQYNTSEQQRLAYAQYYGGAANYQQGTPSQQEVGIAQQRSGSAFGAGPNDSAFPPSQQQQVRQPSQRRIPCSDQQSHAGILNERNLGQVSSDGVRELIKEENDQLMRQHSDKHQAHGRYSEAQNSGHNTPNPALGGQQPTGPSSQSQHMHQPHAQPGHSGNYPYNHPYYGSPYYTNYMNQYGGYGQGGYSNFGMGGKYGHPNHYGMSPQASFDQHSSSPANAGGFGSSSMHGREAGLGAGLGDYGRSVSGATVNQHSATAGSAGFGGLPDVFGRSQGGYGGQNAYGQQQTGQQGSNEDSLKPFGDNKSGGPSPSALGAQPGRPGSATNNTAGGQGHPQGSHQQGFGGGYPGHLQGGQGNQYGGLGGLGHQGGHQGAGSHQQGSYGNYGGFGGGYGGGSYRGGGWGQSYGHN
ncbi:hypothetical protein P280DRAFT_535153 [Massarina eburnea CBS 473.64]|uniref:RNA polymerase II degradation factor 1 n=1 Tax=Massarina eburnea CBS 473.64 TaxID=1395130 RepID=A0A6A6SAM2_9PLEO|nr:hypothetical protein P280DRAFT_535153 [Massarina eburnea CBS 473.64]